MIYIYEHNLPPISLLRIEDSQLVIFMKYMLSCKTGHGGDLTESVIIQTRPPKNWIDFVQKCSSLKFEQERSQKQKKEIEETELIREHIFLVLCGNRIKIGQILLLANTLSVFVITLMYFNACVFFFCTPPFSLPIHIPLRSPFMHNPPPATSYPYPPLSHIPHRPP